MKSVVRKRTEEEFDERLNELLMPAIEQMERGETEDADIVFERLIKRYQNMVV